MKPRPNVSQATLNVNRLICNATVGRSRFYDGKAFKDFLLTYSI